MNKNVEQAHNKIFFAVVSNFKSEGEEKLILHEASINKSGEICYGIGNTLVIDPAAVLRIDKEVVSENLQGYGWI